MLLGIQSKNYFDPVFCSFLNVSERFPDHTHLLFLRLHMVETVRRSCYPRILSCKIKLINISNFDCNSNHGLSIYNFFGLTTDLW